MRIGRPQTFALTLSDMERSALTAMATARTLPYSHVRRAQIILASADGESNTAIAERFELAMQTVGYWRGRFHAHRLAGLSDAPRSGRPRTYHDDRVAALLRTVLTSTPKAGTHWSVRRVADETGIAESTVQRYFTRGTRRRSTSPRSACRGASGTRSSWCSATRDCSGSNSIRARRWRR